MAVPQAVRLVVDCSVLLKWELLDEEYADTAAELLRDWQAEAVVVESTDLLPSEIGSALLRTLRRGRISEVQARSGIQYLLSLPVTLHSSIPLVNAAFELAYRYNQRIYDCFYVALAERERVDLWTSDERLYNALRSHLPLIRFLADYVPL